MRTLSNITQVEAIQCAFNFREKNNECVRLLDFAAGSNLFLSTMFFILQKSFLFVYQRICLMQK